MTKMVALVYLGHILPVGGGCSVLKGLCPGGVPFYPGGRGGSIQKGCVQGRGLCRDTTSHGLVEICKLQTHQSTDADLRDFLAKTD